MQKYVIKLLESYYSSSRNVSHHKSICVIKRSEVTSISINSPTKRVSSLFRRKSMNKRKKQKHQNANQARLCTPCMECVAPRWVIWFNRFARFAILPPAAVSTFSQTILFVICVSLEKRIKKPVSFLFIYFVALWMPIQRAHDHPKSAACQTNHLYFFSPSHSN